MAHQEPVPNIAPGEIAAVSPIVAANVALFNPHNRDPQAISANTRMLTGSGVSLDGKNWQASVALAAVNVQTGAIATFLKDPVPQLPPGQVNIRFQLASDPASFGEMVEARQAGVPPDELRVRECLVNMDGWLGADDKPLISDEARTALQATADVFNNIYAAGSAASQLSSEMFRRNTQVGTEPQDRRGRAIRIFTRRRRG